MRSLFTAVPFQINFEPASFEKMNGGEKHGKSTQPWALEANSEWAWPSKAGNVFLVEGEQGTKAAPEMMWYKDVNGSPLTSAKKPEFYSSAQYFPKYFMS